MTGEQCDCLGTGGPGLMSYRPLPESVTELETEVLEAWEVPMERDLSNGEITHPALVHVLAPDGTVAYSFNGPPVNWVTAATRAVG